METVKSLFQSISQQVMVGIFAAMATTYVLTVRHDERIGSLQHEVTGIKAGIEAERLAHEAKCFERERAMAEFRSDISNIKESLKRIERRN